MKLIKLTQGKFAQVDDEDFDYLNQWKWHVVKSDKNEYASRQIRVCKNRQISVKMHRNILNLTDSKLVVDHKDNNGLNNQKSNIRICSNDENIRNRRKKKDSASQYLGVYYHKRIKKWQTSIQHNNVKIHLGYFENENDAAKCYDENALKYHGEFANLNFK